MFAMDLGLYVVFIYSNNIFSWNRSDKRDNICNIQGSFKVLGSFLSDILTLQLHSKKVAFVNTQFSAYHHRLEYRY